MKRALLFAVPLALMAWGCDPQAQQGVQEHGSRALKEAGKAGEIALQSVLKKVQELDAKAAPETRKQTEKLVDDLRAQLEKIPNPSPEVQKQIEALKQAASRLDAQKMAAEARAKMEEMTKKAQDAGQSAEEARKKLEETNRQFQELKKQADDAQKQADDAKRKIDDLSLM